MPGLSLSLCVANQRQATSSQIRQGADRDLCRRASRSLFFDPPVSGSMAMSRAGETPIYGPDGKYQGSVFDYGRTQTYTDRSGHFTGSAVSSIDRALNFGRGR